MELPKFTLKMGRVVKKRGEWRQNLFFMLSVIRSLFYLTQFFPSGLWFLKLENHLRSQVASEVANKLKGYLKVLKRNHAYL